MKTDTNKIIQQIRNNELSIFALLYGGYTILIRNYKYVLIVLLTLNLPLEILLEIFFPVFSTELNIESFYIIYVNIAYWILLIPSYGTTIKIFESYLHGSDIDFLASLRFSLSKWFSITFRTGRVAYGDSEITVGILFLLGAQFIANLYFPAYPFLLIIALGFLTRQFFFIEAAYLRELGVEKARKYSRSLVQGRWLKVFITIIMLSLNQFCLSMIVLLFMHFLSTINSDIIPYLGISYRMLETLLLHYYFAVNTILFINLEHRKVND